MPGIRKDIATLKGPWAPEMIWYARAVGELRTRLASNRVSWTYLAAIHGINVSGWTAQSIIAGPQDLPPQPERDVMFNQCQHGGWYFPPWHRGYLWAFEAIVANVIGSLGGPEDWALPYWNYLNAANPDARDLPPEFTDATLPDGTPNPLSNVSRHGTTRLGPTRDVPTDIDLRAQTNFHTYTAAPGTLAYGGGVTAFSHHGGVAGALELNPHNIVHVMLGGQTGWMSDPNYAALDPVFWFHHCNIDRLWEAWISDPANRQERGPAWSNGPFPRQFRMPTTSGGLQVFLPGDTLPGKPLAPSYDDLTAGTGIRPAAPALAAALGPAVVTTPVQSVLSAANDRKVSFMGDAVSTRVEVIASAPLAQAIAPAGAALASPAKPARHFLNLEGVHGAAPSAVIDIAVMPPAGQAAANATPRKLDTVVLFGLAKASTMEGPHAGAGLTVAIDVTDAFAELAAEGVQSPETLEIRLSQPGDPTAEITVDRVSIYSVEGE